MDRWTPEEVEASRMTVTFVDEIGETIRTIDGDETQKVQKKYFDALGKSMQRIVAKKILPLFLLLMTAMTPLCSAESWQLVGKEDGSDRDYYVDFDSTWYNGILNGGGLTKVRSTETGFSAILTLKFQNNQDGTFDVTFTNGKAYDADGNLLYGSDLDLQHHSVAGAVLSKVCQAMMDISTARI